MAKSKTVKAIDRAEKALETSKRRHREAFRKALADTFEEYGLALSAGGPAGAKLAIVKFDPAKPTELPE